MFYETFPNQPIYSRLFQFNGQNQFWYKFSEYMLKIFTYLPYTGIQNRHCVNVEGYILINIITNSKTEVDRIVWVWERLVLLKQIVFCQWYREKECRDAALTWLCLSKLSKIHIIAVHIWQRQNRLLCLSVSCVVWMSIIPRYINRVARNEYHRVIVRGLGANHFLQLVP